MEKKKWQLIYKILIVVGIGLLGFYLGRKTYKAPKNKPKIEYIQGKTEYKFVSFPIPFRVIAPTDTADIIKQCVKDGIYAELFPEKTTTIYVSKEDTTAIMKDWSTERFYSEILFDSDTLGKMLLNTNIQYNRIKNYSYEFSPVTKVIDSEQYIVKAFSPYIGMGVTFNPWDETKDIMPKISAGFFIKEKVGLQVDYQHSFTSKNDFIGGSILVKF